MSKQQKLQSYYFFFFTQSFSPLIYFISKIYAKGENFMRQGVTSICDNNAFLRVWNLIYMKNSTWWNNNDFISLSVSHSFKNPQMRLDNSHQIWQKKNWKFCPNYHKSTKFLWQFYRQIFTFDHKPYSVWIFVVVRVFLRKLEYFERRRNCFFFKKKNFCCQKIMWKTISFFQQDTSPKKKKLFVFYNIFWQ